MKRILSLIVCVCLICIILPVKANAASNYRVEKISIDEEIYYLETVITRQSADNMLLSVKGKAKSITASKTTSMKDSKQNVLWYVSITGTFSYDNKTATCTSCSHRAGSNSNKWSIKNVYSSKSGNSATATATAKKSGLIEQEQTQSVTISCTPSGTIN